MENKEGREQPRRPGSSLSGRPGQWPDGSWRDHFGEKLPEDQARDYDYASKFWAEPQSKGMRDAMKGIVQNAASHGEITLIASSNRELTEADRERLSAYRTLANELGYEIGRFRFNPGSGTATAEVIRKKQEASEV